MLDIDGRRTRFCETLSKSSKELFLVTFNGFEDYEASIGKYIEDMDDDEFGVAMNLITKKSSRTNMHRRHILSRYFTWCKQNGYNSREHKELSSFDGKEEALLSVVKKTMFASPAHLQSFLDKVFEPVETGTADCLYRAFIWLVYIGLTSDEIERVRTSDVDLNKFSIRIGSTEYKIYSESLAAINACIVLDELRVDSPRVKDGFYYTKRWDGNLLLRRASRGARSHKSLDKVSYFRLRTDTSKKIHAAGFSSELDSIRKSGDFYRTFQREQIEGEPDFSMYIIRSIEADPDFSGKRKDLQQKSIRSIRNFVKKDYELWKSAFNMK